MNNRATTPKPKAPSRKEAVAEEKLLAEYERSSLRSGVRGPEDLRRFQSAARAAAEGLPYQTLISSVLHKFVTGRLIDRS